ncbi:hypothetical protein ACSBR1_026462 [Camellia fascicularis]
MVLDLPLFSATPVPINGMGRWCLLGTFHICISNYICGHALWTAFVWGLVGHCSIFGDLSPYLNVNRFFLGGGTIDPLLVWFSHKAFPERQ